MITGTFIFVFDSGNVRSSICLGECMLLFLIAGMYFLVFDCENILFYFVVCTKILEVVTASIKIPAIIIFVSTRFFGKHGRIGNTMP